MGPRQNFEAATAENRQMHRVFLGRRRAERLLELYRNNPADAMHVFHGGFYEAGPIHRHRDN